MLVLAWCSALLTLVMPRRGDTFGARAGRSLLLVAGCGSLLFITLVVARSEHRFLLPLGTCLAAYAGIGADALLGFAASLRAGRPMALLLGGLLTWSGLHSFAVHLTQFGDARRTTAAWLARLPPAPSSRPTASLVYSRISKVSAEAPTACGAWDRSRRAGAIRCRRAQTEGRDRGRETRRPDVLVLSNGCRGS